ncbi:MAG: YggS family pyridoxal phosphate-dependent enzyme [Gammaproteobacteria bacterium]|nr:YggS family pyridoxal phosphate-dependent enzyme [Gammaproteobacteria bacterium]MDP6617171.1 YggS family pyridoxal phosphate-dependent enzyme [Gammaproteobacteria bacterium]MDP6695380.1 YggS family pyridoxal phosphate-dependent enzyme [Gammaproteobacteria bacterium]MDP7042157.1 YggS family pyridoxal phosphate-dependent enzyme [Gammaproteobacteria bacterium]
MTRFTKHLTDLKSRIRAASELAGRNENDVSILAVSKRHGVDAVHEAVSAGLRAMGENYVQEALEKMPLCDPSVEWHFIGRIQSNKTRQIAGNFSWVQTVCTDRIARRLGEQRPEDLPPLNVCVQVCIDGDTTHGGVMPDEAAGLCRIIEELPRLKLRGLMTIPVAADNPEAQRIPFRALRELRDELAAAGHELDTLSMGMTGDLEAAVLEGSTMLRIGTALFGPRPV